MTGEPIVTLVGGLTADPELRYTQNGLAVANFTIAQTPRSFDRAANEWKEGETLFIRCSIWRDYAEHVAGSLVKGNQVIAVGRLTQRGFTDKDGNKRTSIEMEVDDIGPALRFATAQVVRTGSRTQSNNQAQQRAEQGGQWAQPGQAMYAPQQGAPQQAGWQQPQGQQQYQAQPAAEYQQQAGWQQPAAQPQAPVQQQPPAQQQAPQPSVWNAPVGQPDPDAPF